MSQFPWSPFKNQQQTGYLTGYHIISRIDQVLKTQLHNGKSILVFTVIKFSLAVLLL